MHQRVDLQLRLVERVLLMRLVGRLDHFGAPEIASAFGLCTHISNLNLVMKEIFLATKSSSVVCGGGFP